MDEQTVGVITQMVGNLGFPIFTAIWMMMKNSKDMQMVSKAINDLEKAILALGGKSNE